MLSPLSKIRSRLKRRRLDALLVTQPENRRYLSGFTAEDTSIAESSGVLLVPFRGAPFLLTDFRYQLQAETEAAGFEVQLYNRGLMALLKKLLPALGIKRLAFESHYTLHSTSEALEKTAKDVSVELVALRNLIEKIRERKNKEELRKIERSVALNEQVFQEVYADLYEGMTERDAAIRIETAMRLKGAEGPSFETIVAGGPNSALPHAVPTDRPLTKGEPIIIDMGLKLDGYCSDMTRTVALGTPSEKMIQLSRLVRKAQLAATEEIRAGKTGYEVDRTARRIIAEAGYGDRFGHGLGHGVGLAVHENPSLSKRNRKKLRAGMVVTVEPGIYLPGWGGIRLENMVAVEKDGCRLLNQDTTFLDL